MILQLNHNAASVQKTSYIQQTGVLSNWKDVKTYTDI